MRKSFVPYHSLLWILFLSGSAVLISSCGKDKNQQQFVNEALSTIPEGITEMTAAGVPKEDGATDPKDWRISPDYAGLVSILTPAYPNPVAIGQPLKIDIDLGYAETVSRLQVYVLNPNSGDLVPLYQKSDLSIIETIPLNADHFADQVGVGNSNIYRILIYDGRGNIISYGDVKVE